MLIVDFKDLVSVKRSEANSCKNTFTTSWSSRGSGRSSWVKTTTSSSSLVLFLILARPFLITECTSLMSWAHILAWGVQIWRQRLLRPIHTAMRSHQRWLFQREFSWRVPDFWSHSSDTFSYKSGTSIMVRSRPWTKIIWSYSMCPCPISSALPWMSSLSTSC